MEDDSTVSSKSTDSLQLNTSSTDVGAYNNHKRIDVAPKSSSEILQKLPEELRCSLGWKDLAYYVPVSATSASNDPKELANELAAGDEEPRGLPLPTVTKIKEVPKLQTLFPTAGRVNPNEMVAIMGPSGSGKTTLLNLLSQRTRCAAEKCAKEGSVYINEIELNRQEFSKVGAYVQQEDGLMDVLSPREIFEFACRIRIGCSEAETQKRVDAIIERLSLQSCQSQMIGAWDNRGISSGERKRVSIGYEMLTEPSVLLLDEPTSGLDSQSARQIIHQLRLEAQRGLSVIATIHQPSSEVFFMFDRVIVLSEGHTIYNGRPHDVRTYFEKKPFNMVMGLYSNPADKLLTLASYPRKCIAEQGSDQPTPLIILENHAREATKEWLAAEDKDRQDAADKEGSITNRLNVNTLIIARKVTFAREIQLIWMRILTQCARLPLALLVLAINGIIQGCLQSEMFHGVVGVEFTMFDRNLNEKKTFNMLGLAFMAASDQFTMMSMAQVLQIPIARPIFEREVANRTYSASAYYLASSLASLLIFFLYPCFTALISYWYLGFEDMSWTGLFRWMVPLAMPAFAGSLWGFTFGTFFTNTANCLQWNMVFIMLFNLGAGHTTNLGTANYFAKFISTVSPVRYGTELLMKQIVKGKAGEPYILALLGFTKSDTECYLTLLAIFTLLFGIGWFNLLRTNQHD